MLAGGEVVVEHGKFEEKKLFGGRYFEEQTFDPPR